jgi:type I restriction enzyme S subunit
MSGNRGNEKLPEGWKRVRLGEVGKIVTGSTPDTSKPQFWNGNIVWITPDDLSKLNTKYIHTSKRKITSKGLKSCSAKLIPPNSIIISSRAPIGYLAISKIRFATNQGCKSIILNSNNDPEFFYYCLHKYIQKMIALGSGTTFSEISKSGLGDMQISVPKLKPEQHRIAEILETVDNAIEKTDRIIQKYKRIKQGLMQDLLTKGLDENGQIRSEETHRFKDSPLGRIPEEWEVVELGKVALSICYGYTESSTNEDVGPKFLRITDIQENKVNWDDVPYCKIDKSNLDKYLLKEGDIVFARTGATTGKSYYINNPPFAIFASYLVMIRPNSTKISPKFLSYFFNSDKYWAQIAMDLSGSTQEGFNASKLSNIQLPLPPLPEQHRIASILSQIDETIEKEQKYKEKLERIKQGLMKDLLTGRVRVNYLIEEKI